MSDSKDPKKDAKKKKKEKEPDITFYHPDLFEIPEDGSPPFLKGRTEIINAPWRKDDSIGKRFTLPYTIKNLYSSIIASTGQASTHWPHSIHLSFIQYFSSPSSIALLSQASRHVPQATHSSVIL